MNCTALEILRFAQNDTVVSAVRSGAGRYRAGASKRGHNPSSFSSPLLHRRGVRGEVSVLSTPLRFFPFFGRVAMTETNKEGAAPEPGELSAPSSVFS